MGKPKQAQVLWQQGLEQAEKLALSYEQARAHYELGRHLPPTAPARTTHLEAAHQLFTQLKVDYERQQILALL